MRPILQVPDSRLRGQSLPVVVYDSHLSQLCLELEAIRVACRQPRALGLAAPQIGEMVRVVSLNPGEVIGHRFMINPEITHVGANKNWGEEGCMSINGGRRKFRVRRWDTITVRFEDLRGAQHGMIVRGFPARVVQHEIDHLNGVMVDGGAVVPA